MRSVAGRDPLLEIAVIVTGEPIAAARARFGGFSDLIRRAANAPNARFVAFDAREALPDPGAFAATVVTGSASSVTERAPWMLATEHWLERAVVDGSPVLGICFGHQLLGQALGGRVEKNPRGREIGTVRLERVAGDELLDALAEPLRVNMTHMDSIVELPPGVTVIARTERDPNSAVRFGEWCWGVQFHPEIDREVMADYIEGRAEAIEGEGLDLGRIRAELGEGAAGREVLRSFLARVAARGFER
jgi:GMP synthase (glutamine-hydrolysing)